MFTTKQSIKLWKEGNKREAYYRYMKDEGSFDISYETFLELFEAVVKRHDENIATEEAHSKSVRVD